MFILIPTYQPEESLDQKRLMDRSGEYYFLDTHRASTKEKSVSPVKLDKSHHSASTPAQENHEPESRRTFLLNRAELTVLSICVNAVALALLGVIWTRHGYSLPLNREKRRIQ